MLRADPRPAAGLGLDSRSLDALRNEAARNPNAAARQAAVQFESLFMQMVVKSMRDATPKAEGASPATENFTSMLDTQLSKQFAGRPGGLAEMIEKQLTRHMGNLPPVSAQNAAAAAAQAQAQAQAQAHTQAAAQPRAKAVPSTASFAAATAAPRGADPIGALKNVGSRAAEFVRRMLPHAQEAERQTGVPASFILGQAALESGWGRSEIRHPDGSTSFNLFGIKATSGWKGDSARVMTTEYEGGQPVRQRAGFRSYASYSEAFADYARLLTNSPRYAGVVRNASTPEQFAEGLQRAGYATDPRYADKLERTINTTLALQRAMG